MVKYTQKGFTLIELIMVLAILGVLAAIALPNYQSYVKKTKRNEMMVELQKIAQQIEAQKVTKGNYANVTLTSFTGNYPKGASNPIYTVSITPTPLTRAWKLTATPKAGSMMDRDGILTLSAQGIKCHASACGQGDEWRK